MGFKDTPGYNKGCVNYGGTLGVFRQEGAEP